MCICAFYRCDKFRNENFRITHFSVFNHCFFSWVSMLILVVWGINRDIEKFNKDDWLKRLYLCGRKTSLNHEPNQSIRTLRPQSCRSR